jgi:hypothetical protein
MNKTGWLLILILTAHFTSSWANEMILTGSYQGKDLFVQNPYNAITKNFCTEKVFVNDQLLLENPKISAYKVDMSYLKVDDLVVIRIIYSEGCQPSIVNPQVLKSRQDFQFLTVQTDHNSITWSAKGETPQGVYFLEQKWENKKWKVIDTIAVKAGMERNTYAIPPAHQKGENTYRIKYLSDKLSSIYSLEMQFTATDNYITFYPYIATIQLKLSDSTAYEITDFFGKMVKKGEGTEISVLDLKPGKYYLNIQNRKERFIKK